MLSRRIILAAAIASPLATAAHAESFPEFLASVRGQALRSGISQTTVDRALARIRPNPQVIEHDRHQPEFTLTWAEYRARVLSEQKMANGRVAFRDNARLLSAVSERYGVAPGIVVGIWGLESAYGAITGDYNVIEALATLGWEGRRANFFRTHLITALRILDEGDVSFSRMTGSYAGAMGQPQFMPDSFVRYAVDFDNDGRRDIWDSKPDVLASIANYLAKNGWRSGEPWSQPIVVPDNFDPRLAGRETPRSLGEWEQLGVRRADGARVAHPQIPGAVLLPDGPGGDAFMTYANFNVVRRYNPSDFYALAVGLLADSVII
ncbi:MAG: lytic murein transglycosylase [Acetobacteraceae bacterium]|nr:lytic murein transglycosylase [Acetobacteraceae bacterium]